MSNLSVTIHKNVDFEVPADIAYEQAVTSNEFSSILAPVIRRAWLLAHALGHGQVLVEHFITALFAEEESRRILERHDYFDDDGEQGQKLTKRRSGFGAPTFDQALVSPGKLLPSPHLDAWFRAARYVASTREREHVTVVVDDFLRVLEPDFDKSLAAETVESLEFVRGKLKRQGREVAPRFKAVVVNKIDEVLQELRGEVSAANAARTKAMELLSAGLHQLGAKVDGLDPRISAVNSNIHTDIFAADAARRREVEYLSAGLQQLEAKVDGLNPGISAMKSEIYTNISEADAARTKETELLTAGLQQLWAKIDELNPRISAMEAKIDTNISAMKTEIQEGAAKLSAVEHSVAIGLSHATMLFKSIQESLGHAQDVTHKQLSTLSSELTRKLAFGRTINGLLPAIAIAAGAGIGLIARIAFGPL